MRRRLLLVSLLVLFGALACGEREAAPSTSAAPTAPPTTSAATAPPTPTAPAPPAAPAAGGAPSPATEAEQIFATRCTTCHGSEGLGNGPGAAALDPKPRNFQDSTWQASVTDEHLAKIIQNGGAAVGKSPAMPPNPDLVSKPEVVRALVAHVRSLAR